MLSSCPAFIVTKESHHASTHAVSIRSASKRRLVRGCILSAQADAYIQYLTDRGYATGSIEEGVSTLFIGLLGRTWAPVRSTKR